MFCKCRTQDEAGLKGPGDALCACIFFHLINYLHLWLHWGKTRDISFSSTGRRMLRELLNSLLCWILVTRENLCVQTPSALLIPMSTTRSRLSHLSCTGAGDLTICLLRGRLLPFECGRKDSCHPLHVLRGFIPFSHRFVPPPSVPTWGRVRWGSQCLNICLCCKQHTNSRTQALLKNFSCLLTF